MKIFFDTEFTGLQKNTTLISLGLVSEDGRTFYAEFNDYDESQVNNWIRDNVINNLLMKAPGPDEDEYYIASRHEDNPTGNYLYNSYSVQLRGDKEIIRNELTVWFEQFDSVELVSDVCHYDMVLLIDIFGHAFNMPDNVCPVCYDINQDIARHYNISQAQAFDYSREDILIENNVEVDGKKHNALYDALVIKELYRICQK